jgi:adhesin HecA-like repeat protein
MSTLTVKELAAPAGFDLTLASGETLDVSGGTLVGGGKVLQVVEAQATSSDSNPTTSFSDIAGSSITITPSATTSKILLMWNCGGMAAGGNNDITIRCRRGTTTIRQIDRYSYDTGAEWKPCPIAIQYLDEPSTTSATTYKLQCLTTVNADFRINSEADTDSFVVIAMEIGA